MASDPTTQRGFRRNASPQAIRARIDDLRRKGDRIESERRELEDMLDERLAQIDAGTWPPRRRETDDG